MLLILLVALAGGVVSLVVGTLIVLCCFEAVGNTYRALPAGRRRKISSTASWSSRGRSVAHHSSV